MHHEFAAAKTRIVDSLCAHFEEALDRAMRFAFFGEEYTEFIDLQHDPDLCDLVMDRTREPEEEVKGGTSKFDKFFGKLWKRRGTDNPRYL